MGAPGVRPGRQDDLAALNGIYNHYVRATPITFDTREIDDAGRRAWFEAFAETGPHRLLVAELAGRTVGYACSRAFRAKPAYARSVETSVYLDPEHLGRGIGTRLYTALLGDLCDEPSVHRAYAGIALPNPESVALHERLGFEPVGTFREVGFKLGRYWDVCWYERDVSGPDGDAGGDRRG